MLIFHEVFLPLGLKSSVFSTIHIPQNSYKSTAHNYLTAIVKCSKTTILKSRNGGLWHVFHCCSWHVFHWHVSFPKSPIKMPQLPILTACLILTVCENSESQADSFRKWSDPLVPFCSNIRSALHTHYRIRIDWLRLKGRVHLTNPQANLTIWALIQYKDGALSV